MFASESVLPHINASLNALAMVLLVIGYVLIKRGHERAHRRTMVACFGVSVLFLCCYLCYHSPRSADGALELEFNHRTFPEGPAAPIRYTYYAILISHIVLAATVPFLALRTIYLGYRDRRSSHRRLARWTFPIWLYVSITGVLVYYLLYHAFPPA